MVKRLIPAIVLVIGCSGDDGGSSTPSTGSETSTSPGSTTASSTSDGTSTGSTTDSSPSDGSTSSATTDSSTSSGATGSTSSGAVESSSSSTGVAEGCAHTFFVNFDGPTMQGGPDDDAPSDTTQIADFEGDLDPYAGPLTPDEVISVVASIFAPYSVCVTSERPAQAPYRMVVVTASDPTPAFGMAISPVICDGRVNNSVAFVMPDGVWDVDATALANQISWAFGPLLGLGVVSEDGDIMCQGVGCSDPPNVNRGFTDSCLVLGPNASCDSQHEANCPAGQQNAHQELLTRLGPAE